jgi:tellurite resistance protein
MIRLRAAKSGEDAMSTFMNLGPQALQKKASIKNLPVSLFASVMGIAGMSLAWRQASQEFGVSLLISEAAGILALLVFAMLGLSYITKAIRYPEAAVAEFKHPIAGNFFGTITITILLLSSIIAQWNQAIAEIVWVLGTIVTLAFCFAIVGRLLKGKIDVTHAVPAWFIPGVATLDIAVAGGTMPMAWAHEINLFALAVGTMIAVLFFTMIISRIIHHEPVPAGMVPSLMILMAPFEVGFLAYTNFTQSVDTFAGLLFYFGLFIFIALVPKIFRRGIPFASGWWAISFPIAALASAALKYSMFVQAWPLKAIAVILLGILSIAIVVLFFKTLHFLFNGKLLAA